MDLDKYRILLKVIENGSISGTAEECGYTISGVSRMIQALEKEQGFPLLYRSHGGVTPTGECERLLPHIRELLFREKIILEISDEIRSAGSGTISIGIAHSQYYSWIAQRANEFQKLHSGVKFEFLAGYSSELLEKLNEHQLDVCLISERDGTELWFPIGAEEFVAWLPGSHPMAGEAAVPLRFFEKESYIDIFEGADIDNARLFARYGIRPNVTMSAEDSFSVYSMVEAGLGVSLNHRGNCSKWTGDVAVLPLNPPEHVTVGLATTGVHSPLVDAFWKFCSDILK